jgi:hypothetical protein
MTFRLVAMSMVAALLLSSCACSDDWAYFPKTLPYKLPGIEPGAHLTESQAKELAVAVAIHHRTNPANYAPPSAGYNQGEWHVYFGGLPGAALGGFFSVYIYEQSNRFSFSPGR